MAVVFVFLRETILILTFFLVTFLVGAVSLKKI